MEGVFFFGKKNKKCFHPIPTNVVKELSIFIFT